MLWGKASPLKSKNGKIIGAIETIQDITPQKLLEIDLKDNEERYHSIFTNNLSVMLIISPVTGDIIDGTPYSCKNYGYSHEALVTMNIFEINQLSCEKYSGR
jgi:PAS domain-containing protein